MHCSQSSVPAATVGNFGSPREECIYLVPCAETCCDRFPFEGGVALVRPGRSLRANEYESAVEIARVPASSRGLLGSRGRAQRSRRSAVAFPLARSQSRVE